MLMGEYRHNLDDKGRIIIPSKARNELGDNLILTRGLDGCLFGYSQETWNEITNKLNTLPFTKKDARNFTRFFTSGAIALEFDKQGRVNIPEFLRSYASIEKEVVIVGVLNRIEIWSMQKWTEFINNNYDSLSDISENLFNSNFEL